MGEVLAGIEADSLMERLRDYRWTGRPGYAPEAMWRAMLMKYLLRIQHTRELIRRLKSSPVLRYICGFGDVVPHESSFSRFVKRLSEHHESVAEIVVSTTVALQGKDSYH